MIHNDCWAVNRRNFIKTLAAAGFGVTVGRLSVTAESLPPTATSQRRPYFFGSEVPLTYIRDYSGGHLDNEAFIKSIADETPDLLVLGKDAPIHHNWGPVAGTGGENQAFGQGADIRRLSPDELTEKMSKIRMMVSRLHLAGVRWVMPYICTITIGGDPETRGGFWDFYDHWDEYKAFGLGPKPKDDPSDWMQRTDDRKIVTSYYPLAPAYYAPNKRWPACINNPGWRQHLGNVVRLAAEVGYDGVYTDNSNSVQCYCQFCQAKFRQYVAAVLTRAEIKNELGADHVEDLRLATNLESYLGKLTQEFWTDTKVDFLRVLKEIGRNARGAEFDIFANPGSFSLGAHEIARVSAVASFAQSEENGGPTGAHPGLVPLTVGGLSSATVYNRRAFEYKFTQSVDAGMRVCMTSRPGSPRALPEPLRKTIDENPQTASLAIAESAAYGGGGAFKMERPWDRNHAIRLWRAFFAQHPDLYAGGDVWAPVGVVAFAEQFYFGASKAHQGALATLTRPLIEQTVLFDLVHEANFSSERCRDFRAIVVPAGARSLSDAQLGIFRRYAVGGGRLLITGDDFAAFDEKCRPRPEASRKVAGALHLPAKVAPDDLLARLSAMFERPAASVARSTGGVPSGVGINVFRKSGTGAPEEIICHLVNYNVPLGEGRTDPPVPVRDLIATIPLPPQWRPRAAQAFSPNPGEDLDVTFAVTGGVVRLRVPKLNLYQAIRFS